MTYRRALVVALAISTLLHSAMLVLSGFIWAPKTAEPVNSAKVKPFYFEARPVMAHVDETIPSESGLDTTLTSHEKDLNGPQVQVLNDSPPDREPIGPISTERFYTVHEVDLPASPFSDWIVPWEVLRKAQVNEFVVRLWILSTGEVLQADVLRTNPSNVEESVKKSLSQSLLRTQTNPAMKSGVPVASKRTIEVTLDL